MKKLYRFRLVVSLFKPAQLESVVLFQLVSPLSILLESNLLDLFYKGKQLYRSRLVVSLFKSVQLESVVLF